MSKYPKCGDDCEHTMDCVWGIDGWCDRPEGWKCVQEVAKDHAKEKRKIAIDTFMATRIKEVHCTCGGDLKQTRKGSFRGKCTECEKIFQLMERINR